jgi:hypothetical protein
VHHHPVRVLLVVFHQVLRVRVHLRVHQNHQVVPVRVQYHLLKQGGVDFIDHLFLFQYLLLQVLVHQVLAHQVHQVRVNLMNQAHLHVQAQAEVLVHQVQEVPVQEVHHLQVQIMFI